MNIAFFNLMQILALSSGPEPVTDEFINLYCLLISTLLIKQKGSFQNWIGLTIECTQTTILSEKRIRLIAIRNIDTYATR